MKPLQEFRHDSNWKLIVAPGPNNYKEYHSRAERIANNEAIAIVHGGSYDATQEENWASRERFRRGRRKEIDSRASSVIRFARESESQ
jgi:hypothetical protein